MIEDLQRVPLPKKWQATPAHLRKWLDREKALAPGIAVANELWRRTPDFVMFSEQERDLSSSYVIPDIVANPPQGLVNLLQLAQLDLGAVSEALSQEDYPRIATLEEQANRALQTIFEENWTQGEARVTVHIRIEGAVLHILVRSPDGYVSIAERSDGLRWFVALLAFLTRRSTSVPPILLVDEAETHLHYDAQVDLTRMFSDQELASKIIYTTHSAGCLPEDLAAVRIVEPVDGESEESRTRNTFWDGEPGLTPLAMAMGASALALLPTRFAVFTEGGSDLMLLPTLFREAVGTAKLGFHVVPGLAHARREALPDLEMEAPRVAYVLDGDDAGRAMRNDLTAAGISPTKIFVLGEPKVRDLVVEDLVDKAIYVAAVNEEIRRSVGEGPRLTVGSITDTRGPAAVGTWCEENGIAMPNKTQTAARVLEIAGKEGSRVIRPARRALVKTLHANLIKSLKQPVPAEPSAADGH